MQMGGLTLFQALADKMRWHQTRQGILAENVANADTPSYAARDLEEFSFDAQLKSSATLKTSVTSASHISATRTGQGQFATTSSGFEVTPSGNGVSLEDQMMAVSTNDMDYQAVTAIYARSMRLLKTALGKA